MDYSEYADLIAKYSGRDILITFADGEKYRYHILYSEGFGQACGVPYVIYKIDNDAPIGGYIDPDSVVKIEEAPYVYGDNDVQKIIYDMRQDISALQDRVGRLEKGDMNGTQ